MKVSIKTVETRRQQLARFIQQNAYASLHEVRAHFRTSEATARRDLATLAARRQIVRTHGGALAEYGQRFVSFRERESLQADAKRRIGEAARELIAPGSVCYLDFGTTLFALAQALRRAPVADVQIVTNSLPVAELLTAAPGMRVHLLGGEILPRQSALLGRTASRAVRDHTINTAFLSAEAADGSGVWNSQTEIVRLQRRVLAHAGRSVLCLDAAKLGRTAPARLAPWADFDLLVTDASADALRAYPAGERRHV